MKQRQQREAHVDEFEAGNTEEGLRYGADWAENTRLFVKDEHGAALTRLDAGNVLLLMQ